MNQAQYGKVISYFGRRSGDEQLGAFLKWVAFYGWRDTWTLEDVMEAFKVGWEECYHVTDEWDDRDAEREWR